MHRTSVPPFNSTFLWANRNNDDLAIAIAADEKMITELKARVEANGKLLSALDRVKAFGRMVNGQLVYINAGRYWNNDNNLSAKAIPSARKDEKGLFVVYVYWKGQHRYFADGPSHATHEECWLGSWFTKREAETLALNWVTCKDDPKLDALRRKAVPNGR